MPPSSRVGEDGNSSAGGSFLRPLTPSRQGRGDARSSGGGWGWCVASGRSGFTLVEVLVATLIMVMSIVTVTAAIRQFAIHREKLRDYEQIYSTVLSLRDRITNDTLKENARESGTLNGVPFSYQTTRVESANNYIYGDNPGNNGSFEVSLYKVNLEVEGRSFEFYKTQYKKRFEAPTGAQ